MLYSITLTLSCYASYRQLSIENQRLKDHHEKELNMTKRLSMENEELQWRLRQGKEVSVSMNMSEGTQVHFKSAQFSLENAVSSR